MELISYEIMFNGRKAIPQLKNHPWVWLSIITNNKITPVQFLMSGIATAVNVITN